MWFAALFNIHFSTSGILIITTVSRQTVLLLSDLVVNQPKIRFIASVALSLEVRAVAGRPARCSAELIHVRQGFGQFGVLTVCDTTAKRSFTAKQTKFLSVIGRQARSPPCAHMLHC